MEDLISKGIWGSIEDKASKNLDRWLRNTTAMWVGYIDQDVICVFGVVPPTLLSDRAYLWLWATDKVVGNEFIFVRKSQMVVKELLKRFHKLYGVCEASAERSQRWVKWLGGEFGKSNLDGYVSFVIGDK